MEKLYMCNPINMEYRYQFNKGKDGASRNREAADPSMIEFRGKYYIFPSMTKGFLVSEDLVHWDLKKLKDVPVYDYAPDVRVIGDYIYFSASRRNEICNFYRTKDPESGVFERIEGTFDFWDPNLFADDDGRVYFYWGCSSATPIYGVELDPESMHQKSKVYDLIDNHIEEYGYERIGENHSEEKERDIDFENMIKRGMAQMFGLSFEEMGDVREYLHLMPEEKRQMLTAVLGKNPNIEGAWMTKYNGKYYL